MTVVQLHSTVQEDKCQHTEELVPTDSQGPFVSAQPFTVCHSPWSQMWQHLYYWHVGFCEDWRPWPCHAQETVICKECYRSVVFNNFYWCSLMICVVNMCEMYFVWVYHSCFFIFSCIVHINLLLFIQQWSYELTTQVPSEAERNLQMQIVFRNCMMTATTSVFTRDSIYAIARICHANSVCPSVCHTRALCQNGWTYHRNSFTIW